MADPAMRDKRKSINPFDIHDGVDVTVNEMIRMFGEETIRVPGSFFPFIQVTVEPNGVSYVPVYDWSWEIIGYDRVVRDD